MPETSTSPGPARPPHAGGDVDSDPADLPRRGPPRRCGARRGSRGRAPRTSSRIAVAQRTARTGPSNIAKNPSPAVSSSSPRNSASRRRTIALWRSRRSRQPHVAELGGPLGRADDVREEERRQHTVRRGGAVEARQEASVSSTGAGVARRVRPGVAVDEPGDLDADGAGIRSATYSAPSPTSGDASRASARAWRQGCSRRRPPSPSAGTPQPRPGSRSSACGGRTSGELRVVGDRGRILAEHRLEELGLAPARADLAQPGPPLARRFAPTGSQPPGGRGPTARGARGRPSAPDRWPRTERPGASPRGRRAARRARPPRRPSPRGRRPSAPRASARSGPGPRGPCRACRT